MVLYPHSIDNNTSIPPSNSGDPTVEDLRQAAFAIETELGILPSGVYTNVRARLDILEARINNPLVPSPTVQNPFTIGNSGVTISTGFGAPNVSRLPGSLYLQEDGYQNEGLFIVGEDGNWYIVAAAAGANPIGAAGGDLSSNYPNPTVAKIQGVVISGTPATGYVLEATSPTAASWQAPSGSITLTGDVTGPANSNTVIKINGSTVPAGGALTTGNVLQVSGASALSYGAVNLAGGNNFVTGVLPAANQAAQGMLGDVTGFTNANIVVKINGASVPASGTLTTGNGLYVTGASALLYSSLNLAGGNNFVTGVLPTANQAAQTMGGDVSGTTAAATVTKIQGNPVAAVTLGATQDGYVATWVNSGPSIQFKSAASSVVITINGDVIGPSNASTVAALRGKTISSTPPTVDGYVLTYVLGNNDLEWEPAAGTAANTNWSVSNWYIDPVHGSDGYTGQNSVFTSGVIGPIKTWRELIRRFGTYSPIINQDTFVTFMSSHSDNSDPVIFSPYLNGVSFVIQGTTPTTVASGTIPALGFAPKNKSAGTYLQANLGGSAAVGQMVQNTTGGKSSRAWTVSSSSSIFNITQPFTPQALGSTPSTTYALQPTEVTWASGNTFNLLQPVKINVTEVSATLTGSNQSSFQNGLIIYNCVVFDPNGDGSDALIFGNGVSISECLIQRTVSLRMFSGTGYGAENIVNCDMPGGFNGGKQGLGTFSNGGNGGALFYVVGGIIRQFAGDCIGIFFDGDVIIATGSLNAGYCALGSVAIDNNIAVPATVTTLNIVGNCQLFSDFGSAYAQTIWGQGVLNVSGSAQLLLNTTAVASLLVSTIKLESLTSAYAYNPTGIGVYIGGISITAANIDAAISSGGFGGTAIIPGGPSITATGAAQTAFGTLSFSSVLASPTVTQSPTSGGSGQSLTIQAQGATGGSNNGGNLVLSSGTSGSATIGQVQLQAGGTTIAQVSSNKFSLLKGFNVNVTSTAITYTVLATDSIIAANTTSGPITINLPSSPNSGDRYVIKDSNGTSLTNNITVSGGSNAIDGLTTYIIATAYASLELVFLSGTGWMVI